MKVEIKKLPGSEIEIKTSISWDKWKDFLNSAVADISKNIKIKGFRPGKAPKEIVEKEAGKESVLNEASRKAIQKDYPRILIDNKVEAIGIPQIEALKAEEGSDLEYKLKTAVMPEVKLGPWQESVKKINEKYADLKHEVTEEEIEKELKRLAKSRAKTVTVNREARKGDNVEINFQVLRDGVPVENGTGRKHNLILGSGTFIPGFEDNLMGLKRGDKKEFELEFPENYNNDLSGKKAVFKVEMNLVQERVVPSLDDSFAGSLGEFKNLEELKKSLKDGLKKEKIRQKKEERRAEFTEELIKKTEAEIPKILIQEEIKKMSSEFDMQVRSTGMDPEDYLKRINKNRQELEKAWEPQAIKRIKAALSLNRIAKDREIKVSGKEIEEEMNKTLSRYGDVKSLEKNIDLKRMYSYAEGMLINEKVFQFLEKM